MDDIMSFSPLWGEWEIKGLIGQGAFGDVYRAEKHEYGNNYVSAVKHISIPCRGMSAEYLISEGVVYDTDSFSHYYDQLRDQIIKEINFCYALRGNTNIMSYEDHCIIPKKGGMGYDIFIRMEYLISLPKFIKEHKLSESDIIQLGIEICTALEVLNSRHMIHRDIKPANVFVSPMGVYKLGDFGESKVLSGASVGMTVRGTYAYMSPEISRGMSANITADIYSLGIMLYRFLNGYRQPFVPTDAVSVTAQMQETANMKRFKGEKLPLPINVSNKELVNIVMKACEYEPENRWQTPEEMKLALMSLKNNNTSQAIVEPAEAVPAEEISVINIDSLLRRVFLFLEDGEWKSADEYCEKILDIEPENAQAYLGKLMAELHVAKRGQLQFLKESFEHKKNYQKIMRFGDEQIKSEISGYLAAVLEKKKKRRESQIKWDDENRKTSLPSPEPEKISEAKPESKPGTKPKLKPGYKPVIPEEMSEPPEPVKPETVSNDTAKPQDEKPKKLPETNFKKLDDLEESQPVSKTNEAEKTDREIKSSVFAFLKTGREVKKSVFVFVITVTVVIIGIIAAIVIINNNKSTVKLDIPSYGAAVSAGSEHTVRLRSDGTVIAIGRNTEGQCNVSSWSNIVAVSAGYEHTVGLKSDGTVAAVGYDEYGQCNVSSWTDIVAVSAGMYFTVGLKSDGTVVAVGNDEYGRCDVSSWSNIVAVAAGGYHTVGLKSDGTVVAVGNNGNGQCEVSDWEGIVAVSAGESHTVGLKSDGTVVAVGYNAYDQIDVSDWDNIKAISAGNYHTVGLKRDGTVVAVGKNEYSQCEVSSLKGYWSGEDVVAVSAGLYHTVALREDGVFAVGRNDYGQCDVSDWNLLGISSVSAESSDSYESSYASTTTSTLNLKHEDTDVVISAGDSHTVGLKSDGTAVAVGK